MRKRVLYLMLTVTTVLFGQAGALAQAPVGTAFTYQGQLKQGGLPVTNTADFQFSLWDAAASPPGVQVGTTQSVNGVTVTNGLFTVTLDFGASAFTGDARWLEIAVRSPAGSGSYTTLTPRQELTPAPYALEAGGLIHTPEQQEIFVNSSRALALTYAEYNAFPAPQVIGGFAGNFVSPSVAGATIAGGGGIDGVNRVMANFGTIGGGYGNVVGGEFSTIAGGRENYAGYGKGAADGGGTNGAACGGGWGNNAAGRCSTIAGGQSNSAWGWYSAIGGGNGNVTSDYYSTVAGGSSNQASNTAATVGGGTSNTASGTCSAVGGGQSNSASAYASVVGGGLSNSATGYQSEVGGGQSNQASSDWATVGGGYNNIASGRYSTIAGGLFNRASGYYSFAAGKRAVAAHDGTFVWADDTTSSDWSSTGPSQFLIQAAGGVGIGTNTPGFPLTFSDSEGDKISLNGQSGIHYGFGIQGNLLQIHTDAAASDIAFGWGQSVPFTETMRIKGLGNVGIGTISPSEKLHVAGNICATGTIGACSDQRFKTHVQPLGNALGLVEKLRSVRFDWRRADFPDRRFSDAPQIGLIAQEVREVVPEVVQEGSDGYLSVDYGRLTPVLTQAIRDLKAEKDDEIAMLRTENAELRARLDRLERTLTASVTEKGGDR